jgi:predicted small lipoprotein YifL
MSGRHTALLCAVALAVGALPGCGQKGALYLPDASRTAVPPTGAVAAPAPTGVVTSDDRGNGSVTPDDPDRPISKRAP